LTTAVPPSPPGHLGPDISSIAVGLGSGPDFGPNPTREPMGYPNPAATLDISKSVWTPFRPNPSR
jgi:hypothetical protein